MTRETIQFADGETAAPIPWGEDMMYDTYDDHLESKEEEIEAGGRGSLTKADIREERDRLQAEWDRAEYNDRDCPACGAAIGDPHELGCDFEECPRCGEQYFVCDCDTDEKRELWDTANPPR